MSTPLDAPRRTDAELDAIFEEALKNTRHLREVERSGQRRGLILNRCECPNCVVFR